MVNDFKKNILVLIGSNNINSESKEISKKIFNELSLVGNYKLTELFLNNLNLNYCKGCKSCFKNGYCKLDKYDDMHKIRSELKKADIIFFVVPVYAHNIPGKMKTLIDRLSYEFHLMSLHGKLGISIIITDISGAERVSDYIYDIFTNLGVKQLDSYIYKHCLNNKFNIFKEIGSSISDKINHNKDFTNCDLEYFFKYYKDKYFDNSDAISSFWHKKAVINSNNFQEFCNNMKGK